ncbi:MAG: ABC transporter substrate-binding protein [Tumebacillaceae bacterium]
MKTNMWKSLLALSTLSLLTVPSASAATTTAAKMNINIDGVYQHYDVDPFVKNDRTLVPLRGIFESLGVTVTWTPDKPLLIVATKGSTTITMTMNSNVAYINGQKVTLDVPATVKNDRTFVPVRFISEAMGADVTWDAPTNDVNIISGVYPVGSYTNRQALNLPMSGELTTLDPAKASDTISFDVLTQTNEGLLREGSEGKLVPGVAKEWSVSPDGLTYTFNLRDDAKWSDGSAVTAHDFEYAWKRVLKPQTHSEYSFLLAGIKGASMAAKDASQVQVTATDDHTLVVNLEHPIAYFADLTTFPVLFPVKQSFVESKGASFGFDASSTMSNGPFKMNAWVSNRYSVLTQNANYWDRSNVKLNKIGFQYNMNNLNTNLSLYNIGQLDCVNYLSGDLYDIYETYPGFSSKAKQTLGYLEFNTQVPILKNAKVRKALTYALDGDAYADQVYHNGTVGATGFVPSGVANSAGGEYRSQAGDVLDRKDNASQAKNLLAEGVAEAGLSQFPQHLTLLLDDGTIGEKASAFIKQAWHDNLGIDVDVKLVPFKYRLAAQANQNYQISMALWGADYNDPLTFLNLFRTSAPFNDVKYSNPAYDSLLKQAESEADVHQRAQLLAQAEQLLVQDMPVGPLFFRHTSGLTQPYVKNFVTHEWGAEYDLKTTYISK